MAAEDRMMGAGLTGVMGKGQLPQDCVDGGPDSASHLSATRWYCPERNQRSYIS